MVGMISLPSLISSRLVISWAALSGILRRVLSNLRLRISTLANRRSPTFLTGLRCRDLVLVVSLVSPVNSKGVGFVVLEAEKSLLPLVGVSVRWPALLLVEPRVGDLVSALALELLSPEIEVVRVGGYKILCSDICYNMSTLARSCTTITPAH
ncbi:hypothetical protein F4679DRAFT_182859 [Xylaria curta]|nr:hypothetical protein F4679DRAFT_182859 [Xylaria curta]